MGSVLQVFVAGGSGRLGARIVRELLNKGFKVRVGVRDQAQGESLLKTAIDFGLLTSEAGRKAQIVQFDLLDEATIGPAIGNASKVRCLPTHLHQLPCEDCLSSCLSSGRSCMTTSFLCNLDLHASLRICSK